jgi:anti-anti-sigma factor
MLVRRDQIEMEVSMLDQDIRQIRLIGRLDMKSALLIDTPFHAAITSGGTRVLVDIADVDFMASIGIRLIVVGAKTVSGRGGKLALCNPQPAVAKTLGITGIDNIIPIYPSVAEAASWLREA